MNAPIHAVIGVRSTHNNLGGASIKMVRTASDGKLSLADLIAGYTNTTRSNASVHISRLTDKKLIRPCERFRFGRGISTPVVTEDEWLAIQPLLSPASGLYVLQYSTVWDHVKIGRAQNIDDRVRSLGSSHNFQIKVLAFHPGLGYLEQHIHRRLLAYQSTDGSSTEWFNVPGSYALKVVDEVIQQSRQGSLSSSEPEQ